MKRTIGILALQGAFREHFKAIKRTGNFPVEIREIEQLAHVDGLIIPGGESSTISKLMAKYGFIDALRVFNKPIYGTCAGAILLAKKVPNLEEPTLELMDIEVSRNAYGRQIDSFEADLLITSKALQGGQSPEELDDGDSPPNNPLQFHGVFIRAPIIEKTGKKVEILSEHNGNPVLVRQGKYLAGTFHPELTEDYSIHRMFIGMIESRVERVESRQDWTKAKESRG